jgi:hypothetical protein
MGRADLPDARALTHFYLSHFRPAGLNVHTIHAETEGMGHLEGFTALVRALKERGASFVKLEEIATRLHIAELPVCAVIRAELPGRAGWISMQGAQITPTIPPPDEAA